MSTDNNASSNKWTEKMTNSPQRALAILTKAIECIAKQTYYVSVLWFLFHFLSLSFFLPSWFRRAGRCHNFILFFFLTKYISLIFKFVSDLWAGQQVFFCCSHHILFTDWSEGAQPLNAHIHGKNHSENEIKSESELIWFICSFNMLIIFG